jgi:hypothetical protein
MSQIIASPYVVIIRIWIFLDRCIYPQTSALVGHSVPRGPNQAASALTNSLVRTWEGFFLTDSVRSRWDGGSWAEEAWGAQYPCAGVWNGSISADNLTYLILSQLLLFSTP